MHRSARREQQLDALASALASMAVLSDGEGAGARESVQSEGKWRESVSDVDERDVEEGESEEDAVSKAAATAGRWPAKAAAAARRRGSGGRALHVATLAVCSSGGTGSSHEGSSRDAQAAYWRLFGQAAGGRASGRRAVEARGSGASSADGEPAPEKHTPEEEVVLLREQVALLVQSLEKEQQRRSVEQNLMQTKIIELQGLIRRNLPEQQRALERRLQARASPPASKARTAAAAAAARSAARAMAKQGGAHCHHLVHHHHFHHHGEAASGEDAQAERSAPAPTTLDRLSTPSKPVTVDAADNQAADRGATPRKSEAAAAKKQLTKLRASMLSAVAEAEREAAALRVQLARDAKAHAQRERQLRVECQAALAEADDRQRRAAHKLAVAGRQAVQLAEEKQQLAAMVHAQAECIQRLQLAVGGRQIVERAADAGGH